MQLTIKNFKVNKQAVTILACAIFAIVIVAAHYLFMPMPIDWYWSFYPATHELMSLRSPYNVPTFFNPPWVLLPLVPMALLPVKLGASINFLVSFGVIVYVALKFGAKPFSLAAYLISFPILFLLLYGQIDWLVLLGLVLPPQFGLFLVLAKPQAGLAIAFYWFIDAIRRGGLRETIRVFAPVTIAFAGSLLLYGLWPLQIDMGVVEAVYNYSLFPVALPFGVGLIIAAIRKRNLNISIAASPLFAPYVGPHSWSAFLLTILPYQWEMAGISIVSWVWFFLGFQRQGIFF